MDNLDDDEALRRSHGELLPERAVHHMVHDARESDGRLAEVGRRQRGASPIIAGGQLDGGRLRALKTWFAFLELCAPRRRASESPIAIACFRLVTFLPERPLRNVPRLRLCIARFTFFCAARPYFVRHRQHAPSLPARST